MIRKKIEYIRLSLKEESLPRRCISGNIPVTETEFL